MLKPLLLYPLFILFFSLPVFSQNTFGISAGASVDVNNSGRFKHLLLSFQYVTLRSKVGGLIIKTDIGFPIINRTSDSAFTLESGFPPAIDVQKNISNFYISASVGYRFNLKRKSNHNLFFVDVFLLGVGWQHFKVDYKNYQREYYEVIDPDVTTEKTGVFSTAGIGYLWNRLSLQLHIQSPMLTSRQTYKLSFESNANMQLVINYCFKLSKNKR